MNVLDINGNSEVLSVNHKSSCFTKCVDQKDILSRTRIAVCMFIDLHVQYGQKKSQTCKCIY